MSYEFCRSSSKILCNKDYNVNSSFPKKHLAGDATSPVTRGKQKVKHIILLSCLALSYPCAASAAGSLRCNGKTIKVGVPAAYVLSQCGAPENHVIQESAARARTLTGSSRLTGIALSEQWIYERGCGKFPAVLVFFDGTLTRIDFLRHRSEKATRVY